MKFLLIVLVAALVVWWWRRATASAGRGRAAAPRPEAPQPMLRCAECGLHLPRDEALPGRGGVFCGEPHRAAYERAHPAPP